MRPSKSEPKQIGFSLTKSSDLSPATPASPVAPRSFQPGLTPSSHRASSSFISSSQESPKPTEHNNPPPEYLIVPKESVMDSIEDMFAKIFKDQVSVLGLMTN